MVEQIIEDVNKALDAEAYIAALSLVLTLPDICAKAEYSDNLNNKDRYIKWYDEYIGQYEKAPIEPDELEMPYLSGEVVYQLRCSMLHQGTPNVDSSKIKNNNCKIDDFTLVIEKKKTPDIYADGSSISQEYGKFIRSYHVNVRRLCMIITAAARNCYKNNKDKFDFFNYNIIDWDETCKQINKLREGTEDE